MFLFGALGMQELLVIFLVILLLFGSKRLPELARGLGKGLREFKKVTNEIKNEMNIDPIKNEIEDELKDIGNLDIGEGNRISKKTKKS